MFNKKSKIFILPTRQGVFKAQVFELEDGSMPIIIYIGDSKTLVNNPLIRIHSECITSEVFGSLRCDCAQQLKEAMCRISEENNGMIIYLRQEGRGIGLLNKANAYFLQQTKNLDTVEANRILGFEDDSRNYSFAVQTLKAFFIKSVRLMTNNPCKVTEVEKAGITVEVESLEVEPNKENFAYLKTKKEKFKHMLKMI